jgi:hypothetical protein
MRKKEKRCHNGFGERVTVSSDFSSVLNKTKNQYEVILDSI